MFYFYLNHFSFAHSNSILFLFDVQYMLNSSAAPWTPPTTAAPAVTSSSSGNNPAPSKPPATGSTTITKPSTTTAATSKPTVVTPAPTTTTTTTTTTTVVAPAPAPAKPSVWGSNKSNAILAAPTPDQQAKQQQSLSSQQPQQQQQHPQQGHHKKSTQHKNHHHNRKNDDKNSGQPPQQQQWRNQKNDGGGNWRQHKKGGEEGGGRGGVGSGGTGRHHHQHKQKNDESGSNNNNNNNNNSDGGGGWTRGKLLPLDLLKPNDGKDDNEKAVARIVCEELLSLRMSFLAPPLAWEEAEKKVKDDGDGSSDNDVATNTNVVGPPEECRWRSDTRVQEIDAMTNSKRLGGDVSIKKKKKDNDTAPPLEECKPLEVNEETRWKAGVFKKDAKSEEEVEEDSDEIILKKSLLILNKLSLTKFDKLSDAFIECGIGRNPACLTGAIELIVKKAQDEPHFAAMYAALCLKLAKAPLAFEEEGKRKKFKKMLLTECQKEFEQDTETKMALAVEGIEDEEERQNKANLVKKHYLGHMRFIGELYKGELINIKIMLMCLSALLEGEEDAKTVDEEKIECFAKLMTVIGMILEQQSMNLKEVGKTESSENLANCWKIVQGMISGVEGPKVSNRLKFMLQDLVEMKDNGK